VGDLFGDVGEAIGGVVTDAVNAMMKAIWEFAMFLLGGSLELVDKYTKPTVDPTNGPLAGVLPATIWVSLVVLVLMAFVQIGKGVAQGGRGLGRVLIGFGQYVVVSVGGLTVLAAMLTASNAVASGILQVGLNLDSWQGLSGKNSALTNTANTVSGVGLGLIALLCVIPAALGFLLEGIARNAAILILAATIPILAAGLISDSTRRWFWTGLRWMLALVLMPPGVALAVTIGMRLATGAAGAEGQEQGVVQAIVGGVVAGIVLIISLTTPLALFKLFAFVDPNSLSGAAVRGFFDGGSSGGGGGGSAGSSEGGAESTNEGRFGQALASLDVAGMSDRGAQFAATGSSILDAVGAGHPGGPSGGRGGSSGSSSGDSSDGDDSADTTPPDHDPGGSGGDDDSGSTSAAPGGDGGSGAPDPVDGTSADSASPVPASGQHGSEPPTSGGDSPAPPSGGGDAGHPPAPPGIDGQDPPSGGGGGGGGGPKGGGGGTAAGGEAAEAAVIVA
jgi:hypothetical protein